jgi:hypothetical protein
VPDRLSYKWFGLLLKQYLLLLRYRTDSLVTKDMTYLFICLALGLLCAISNCNFLEIVTLCGIILLLTFLLESSGLFTKEYSKTITYDNIQFIKPEEKKQLLQHLKNSTGLNITRFEILNIDFVKDAATITIYYIDPIEP